MSKTLPMRKLLKLVREVQDTMGEHPDSDVDFLIRGSYESDSDGEVSIRGEAGAPAAITGGVDAEVGGGFSRHWTALGEGEFVLRVSRPGTVTREILTEVARQGGDLRSTQQALGHAAS